MKPERQLLIKCMNGERSKIMSVDNTLVEKALELKPQDKILLIEALVTSLDKPDPEISKIWLQEAEARLKAYREGKTKGITVDEIFSEGL
jgi:putative addiction module component (TIGR02574 family)